MAHVATADVAGGNGKKKPTITNNVDKGAHENSAYWQSQKDKTAASNRPSTSSGSSGGSSGSGGGSSSAAALDYAAQQAAAISAQLNAMYADNAGRLDAYLNRGQTAYNNNLSRLSGLESSGQKTYQTSLANIDKWEKVGNTNYNSNLADINSLEKRGLANYDASDRNINDYMAQGQKAYNLNSQRITDAYGASNDYLTQAYQKALENLQANYDYQRQIANEDAEAAKREAYVNSRLQQNNLAQSLAAMGITGGASESTRAKVANALQNSVNSINSTTARNIGNLGMTYNTNVSSMEQARLDSLAEAERQKAQLLNAIEDALTGVTGNVTSMRNSLNDARNSFLSNVTSARNTARDNYTAFTGNITNSRNSVEENNRAFLTNLANAYANNENAYTNFYGNYTDLANELAAAVANQRMDFYREYGAGINYDDYGLNFARNAMNAAYNAAANAAGYTPQQVLYSMAATTGIDPATLAQSISAPALEALAAAQQQVDTSGFNDIQFVNPEDWSSYIAEVAQLQNIYNPQDVVQATPESNARQYQRWLAQSQAQAAAGANAQAIANNLVQSGVTNQNTLQQILAQLGL